MKTPNLRRLVNYSVNSVKARMSEPAVRRLVALRALVWEDPDDVREVAPIFARRLDTSEPRMNLLIPSINKNNMFGGIPTALKFFEELARTHKNVRILLTDTVAVGKTANYFGEFSVISMENDVAAPKQIVSLASRGDRTLPVGPGDVFVCTAWHTAYLARRLIAWQSQEFSQPARLMIYFIQDYEPGFYPWSSRHLLALSTFKYSGPVIAVFNSSLLKQYFGSQDCVFDQRYSFDPQMDKTLRTLRPNIKTKKHRQLLVYGRPTVPRNAFSLIVKALRMWRERFPQFSTWTVISAGEPHRDVSLGGGLSMKSVGKLNLEEYARVLTESSVGLSLMVSPHPSYPPLEMANYGMWVLTNSYGAKDLSLWHDNIVSVDDYSPENLARRLTDLCRRVEADELSGWRGESHLEHYLSDKPVFPFMEEIRRHVTLDFQKNPAL